MARRFSDILSHPVLKIGAWSIAVIALIAAISAGTRDAATQRNQPPPSAPSFEQVTGRPDPGSRPDAAQEWVDKLARKSGGDWNKLAPEDQQYVNSLTAGHGASYIRDHAKALKKAVKALPSPVSKSR